MSDPVELLDVLANVEQTRAEFIRSRVKDNLAKISDLAKEEFESNFVWVEGEEGDAAVVVNELALVDPGPLRYVRS